MDKVVKNIVLIGMPGCGKTTIGRLLANKLGRRFIDTDSMIESRTGKTISQLFESGEEYFRKLETEAILALEEESACVISTGGGVVKRLRNMQSLKKNGIIFYIDRDLEDIIADINTGTRPLLAGGVDRLKGLYAEREALYKEYSDFVVKNKGSILQAVEGINSILDGGC
jgi:shikimate kinase